jgi:RNA polymerase sigma factor (sigma-70 family)
LAAPHAILRHLGTDDAALEAFAKLAPRQARVVELRYFTSLSEEEIAEVTKTSTRTVERDWQIARAWMMRELSRP